MAHGGAQRTFWILGRMFGRRSSSTSFPLGVTVEFHEFQGRWFVTDQWARGGGAELKRQLSGAALGKVVLARMRGARGPLLAYAAGRRRDAHEWGEFCAEVAGVPVIRYRPEKRLIIRADQAGIRCHDQRHPAPPGEQLPDRSPAALGAALIARIGRVEARWPTAAAATIASDGTTVLVYPRYGIRGGGPVSWLTARSSAADIGSAVLGALDASGAEFENPDRREPEDLGAALRKAGWTYGALNAATHVSIERTTIGELFISSAGSREEDLPVGGQDADRVGAAVMAQFGAAAFTAPVPPRSRPQSFGPKIGWIAVRGSSADAVARVLGLRDIRTASWDDGIETAYREGVFVGPPVEGWVFAAGVDILHLEVDPAALSRQLGSQVQLFRTYRGVGYCEWSRAENGIVTREARSGDEAGEAHQSGEPTEAERALGLDDPEAGGYGEDDVFAIAGAWSLDPTTLHDHPSDGVEGTWGLLPTRPLDR
jgi:hypothetical protein